MAAPIIWSGSSAKLLKPILDFFGQAQILSGTVDPTSVATSAPKGSLYLNTNTGLTYRKTDSGSSTNWQTFTDLKNVISDTFSGNGSQTAFTLTSDPGSINNTFVFVGGVYQEKATYTVSGTTLTFSEAPPTGTNIQVNYGYASTINVPANGSVTSASMAVASVGTSALIDGSVTNAKRAALNYQLSASSGTYSLTGTTAITDVTNLSVTITTIGRPVMIMLVPDGSTLYSYLQYTDTAITVAPEYYFYRNGAAIALQGSALRAGSSSIVYNAGIPPTSVSCFDLPSAGTHTYKFSIRPSATSATFEVGRVKLLAYEL